MAFLSAHAAGFKSLLRVRFILEELLNVSQLCSGGAHAKFWPGGRSASFTYNGSRERVKMYVADGTEAVLRV